MESAGFVNTVVRKVILRVRPREVEISDTWYGEDVPETLEPSDVYELLAEDPIAALEEVTGVNFNDHAWPKILEGLIEVEIRAESVLDIDSPFPEGW